MGYRRPGRTGVLFFFEGRQTFTGVSGLRPANVEGNSVQVIFGVEINSTKMHKGEHVWTTGAVGL